jgi:hypothetical protein
LLPQSRIWHWTAHTAGAQWGPGFGSCVSYAKSSFTEGMGGKELSSRQKDSSRDVGVWPGPREVLHYAWKRWVLPHRKREAGSRQPWETTASSEKPQSCEGEFGGRLCSAQWRPVVFTRLLSRDTPPPFCPLPGFPGGPRTSRLPGATGGGPQGVCGGVHFHRGLCQSSRLVLWLLPACVPQL